MQSSEDSQAALNTATENEHADEVTPLPEQPDIRQPGPDFGSYPNAAAVVAPGQIYLETGFDRYSAPEAYELAALLRLGITTGLELRLNTIAVKEISPGNTSGLGPLSVGMRYYAVQAGDGILRPGIGIELNLVLPTASNEQLDDDKALPSITVNFVHTLPENFSFSWNAGLDTAVGEDKNTFLQSSLQWALGYNINLDVSVYLTGYVFYPASSPGNETNSAAGAGLQWFLSNRIAFNGLYSAALTNQAPDDSIQLSLSFAF